jgi:hypothetical protein
MKIAQNRPKAPQVFFEEGGIVMRRAVLLCGLAVSSILFLAFSKLPEPWRRNEAPVFYVTVSVTPARGSVHRLPLPVPGREYECRVYLHESPASKRIWASDSITVAPGKTDAKTAKLGDLTLEFRASVSEDAKSADTLVVISRGEKILAHQRSIVSLTSSNS